jgi:hypothetical protein
MFRASRRKGVSLRRASRHVGIDIRVGRSERATTRKPRRLVRNNIGTPHRLQEIHRTPAWKCLETSVNRQTTTKTPQTARNQLLKSTQFIACEQSLVKPIDWPAPRRNAHCNRSTMVTPWPQQSAWLTPFHEHATRLIIYLQDALTCIDRSNSQPVPAGLVKNIIHSTLTCILKVPHAPDLNTVCDALRILPIETKTSSKHTTQTLMPSRTNLRTLLKRSAGLPQTYNRTHMLERKQGLPPRRR